MVSLSASAASVECGTWDELKSAIEASSGDALTVCNITNDIVQTAGSTIVVNAGTVEVRLCANRLSLASSGKAAMFQIGGATLRFIDHGRIDGGMRRTDTEGMFARLDAPSAKLLLKDVEIVDFDADSLVKVSQGTFELAGMSDVYDCHFGDYLADVASGGAYVQSGGEIDDPAIELFPRGANATIYGGVFAVDVADYVAEGYSSYAYWDDRFVVAQSGSFAFDDHDEVVHGVFTFDPHSLRIAVSIDTEMKVSFDPDLYTVAFKEGHVFTCKAGGVTATYAYTNGVVTLGNGSDKAVDKALVSYDLEKSVYGYEVTGIASNALAECDGLRFINFKGLPLASVAEGALPSGVEGGYLAEYADEWRAAAPDGIWNGIRVSGEMCNSWDKFCHNLARGADIRLVAALEQGEGVAVAAGSPTIDLAGFGLAQTSAAGLIRVEAQATLSISNSASGGGIVGGADRGSAATVAVASEGTLKVFGGSYSNVSVLAEGSAFAYGGVWLGTNNFVSVADGEAKVYGGVYTVLPKSLAAEVAAEIWHGASGDWHLVAKRDGIGIDGDGRLLSGAFTFDPRSEEYGKLGLELASGCSVNEEPGNPTWLRLVATGSYVAHLPLVDVFFEVKDGEAILGNGTDAIVTNTMITQLSLPAKLGGCKVVKISANALVGCETLNTIEFQGPPIATVEAGAFAGPTNIVETWYTGDYATEWLGAISDGKWQGLTMTRGPYCRTWAGVRRNIYDGYGVQLAENVTQGEGEIDFGVQTNAELSVGEMTLTLAEGRRLAKVPNGVTFHLLGSTGWVRGGNATTGGCFHVEAGGRLIFTSARLIGSQAEVGGGVYVAPGGVFDFASGRIVACRATLGAALAVDGEAKLSDGTLRSNQAGLGGGIYIGPTGKATVNGGQVTCNLALGGAAYTDGGTLSIYGGAFISNRTEAASGSLFASTTNGTISVYGGTMFGNEGLPCMTSDGTIVDYGCLSDFEFETTAQGYKQTALDDFVVTHYGDEFIVDTTNSVMSGVFTFNPREEEYANAGMTVLPECLISEIQGNPIQYQVQIVAGGPYKTVIDGIEWTYLVQNGAAVLGDGVNAACTNVTATAIAIPETINGYKLYSIGKNAFAGFNNLRDLVFDGKPPELFSTGALVGDIANYTGTYSPEFADEWKAVIANGKWNGLSMTVGRCLSWKLVKENLLAGNPVTLIGNVTQDTEAIEIKGMASKLDLNGFTISGLESNRMFRVTAGGGLTISDSATAGKITGVGTCEQNGGFAEVEEGLLYLTGGTISGYKSALDGGAVWVCTNGTLEVAGASFENCCAGGRGGAIAGIGTTRFKSGSIKNCSAQTAGGGISACSGSVLLITGGSISGCTATDGAGVVSSGGFQCTGVKIHDNVATGCGGGIAIDRGAAKFTGGFYANNSAKTGESIYAKSLVLAISGGYFADATGSKNNGIVSESSVLKICGGIFYGSMPENSLMSGWETYKQGDLVIVAQAQSQSWLDGMMTAGVFAFDPSDPALGNIIVTDPYKQVVDATGGMPQTWTLHVNFTVTCRTWDEMRANTLVGNAIQMDVDFAPPSAKKMPNGFVYRGRAMDGEKAAGNINDLTVTIKIYAKAKGGSPLWTGEKKNVCTDTNGTFQVWVDDSIRIGGSATNLVELFDAGEAGYLGIAFDNGSECSPRRALITTPIANRSNTAKMLDDVSTVGVYDGRNGSLTCDTLNISRAICGTLEFTTTNTAFNISEVNVAGCTLYRHADNRIVSRNPGSWVYRVVKPGDYLINNAPKSGLLTVQSTNDCSVPLLTFPVPTGGSFIWRSTPFAGRVRYTNFGE